MGCKLSTTSCFTSLPSPLWRAPRFRKTQQLLTLCPLWGRKAGVGRTEYGESSNSPCGPGLDQAPQGNPISLMKETPSLSQSGLMKNTVREISQYNPTMTLSAS